VKRYFSDNLLGAFLGQYVSQQPTAITIITENDDFGVGFRENFIKSYSGTIIDNLTFNPDEKDF
jgi:ABC-type branched-subunit amino acid transport system substrate-binding protein